MLFQIIFHIVCYYTVWFVCLLTAAQNYKWIGLVTALVISAIQYLRQYIINQTQHLILFMGITILIGVCIDSLFIKFDLLSLKANPFTINIPPPWMIALWINFSITLYACMRKYFSHYILFAVLSLFGFPLAYFAGVHLGAATLPKGYIALLIIAIIWAIVFPIILYCFNKFLDRSNKHYFA